jgi:hypothetical protein
LRQFETEPAVFPATNFHLNLDSLTPCIQPYFSSKNILKDLINENLSDSQFDSRFEPSIADNIFQVESNKSEG